jgi:hypothetical protein
VSNVELSVAHTDALDGCYPQPQSVAEIGANAEWWQLFYDLRAWGLVTFDDDSEEIAATEAGVAQLGYNDEEDEPEPEPEPEPEYDADYISALDGFYEGPDPAADWAEDWEWVEAFVRNGHVVGPDADNLLHITEAGAALLDQG